MLLEVLASFTAVQNLVQPLWVNKWRILSVILICLVLVYLIAVIGYVYLSDSLRVDAFDPTSTKQCSDVFACWLTLLLSTGQRGEYLLDRLYYAKSQSPAIGFFVTVAFFFMYVLFIALMRAVIVDAFTYVREQRDRRENGALPLVSQ